MHVHVCVCARMNLCWKTLGISATIFEDEAFVSHISLVGKSTQFSYFPYHHPHTSTRCILLPLRTAATEMVCPHLQLSSWFYSLECIHLILMLYPARKTGAIPASSIEEI